MFVKLKKRSIFDSFSTSDDIDNDRFLFSFSGDVINVTVCSSFPNLVSRNNCDKLRGRTLYLM